MPYFSRHAISFSGDTEFAEAVTRAHVLGKTRSSLSDFVEFVEPLHAHNARTNRTKFTHRARVDMR
jgi:ABC-type uncharacterized transport system fused permease/ATPase subunit